ncbi:hypothetical protein P167DRAFT_543330 [Morchella conica CCBAS932]|uniref:Uncharacterized protein n=1 Tax=Morchella conica CCBAS932 TaxID=1392247 RepID=A0A3N4L029_9PEZI|nr:hypothetical protein P167DRAFT_543330 [Morchella conica CCBAS932]
MTTPESALHTATVARKCAFAQRMITAYRELYLEASFDLTMIRHSLMRNGYDFRARAPREGVTMTDDMQWEVDRIENLKWVIEECCLFMERAGDWRKDLLLLEMEDVERDEAEAKAEAEKIRMRELELEEEKGVDGSEEVAN